MKIAYLLNLPLFFAPFSHAAGYLVRFKEGSNGSHQSQDGISRLETFNTIKTQGARHSFDYTANKLSLTVLSLTQAKDLVHGKHHHGKSKAQIDGIKEEGITVDGQTDDSAAQPSFQINSNGRWFTFDDNEFHVWHGDFTDDEVQLLANDVAVEAIEKDLVIQFPELQQYNQKKAKENLNQALDDVENQMNLKVKNRFNKETGESEEEQEVGIPKSRESSHKNRNKNKGTISKPLQAVQEYVAEVNREDIPIQKDGLSVQQHAPSWGLPRVSQRTLPLGSDYQYPSSAGQGVDAYVIDTGININHVDFEGRAVWGANTVSGAPDTDDNGHGTFVAGVIGSRTFGVAKKTTLIAVKGLNKDGTSTLSQILAALDWVIKKNSSSSNKLSVVNLSLGAGYSKVLNQAVDNLVQAGLFIVAAAGNGNEHNIGQNACNYSPASSITAFTVGSTNINDQISSYSNFGQCVNIYAPGERVRSTWIGPTNREIYTDSGTSFSAPNVAGIAALIMSTEHGDRSDGSWTPKAIGNRILQLGTRNVINNFKGPANTNVLAYNGAGIIGLAAPTNGTNGDGDQSSNGNGDADSNGSGGQGWNPTAGSEPSKGGPSVSSTSNHGPSLSAIQSITILSTIGSTVTFILTSL